MNKTIMPTPPPLEQIARRIHAHKDELERLGMTSIWLFGSCARNEQKPGSDIDLAVALRAGYGYFDLGEMEGILNDAFEADVHLVMESGISHDHQIRKSMIPLVIGVNEPDSPKKTLEEILSSQ